jgi:hypothetical protein
MLTRDCHRSESSTQVRLLAACVRAAARLQDTARPEALAEALPLLATAVARKAVPPGSTLWCARPLKEGERRLTCVQ